MKLCVVCVVTRGCPVTIQETELVQAKDRAQQQLRQKVNSVNYIMCCVL